MKKLFARVLPADYIEMSFYFDFAEESAGGYVTLITGIRHGTDYKTPEWEKLESIMDDVSYFLDQMEQYGDFSAYRNATELFRDYFPNVTNTRKVHRLKEAVYAWNKNGMEEETACELMELYTGKKWDYAGISGCCQGDFATVYFPHIEDEDKRKEWVDALSAYYFGTGAEVQIHDESNEPADADEISGYCTYIPVPYPNETEIKNYLLEYYGTKEMTADDVKLWIPTAAHTYTHWDYEIA